LLCIAGELAMKVKWLGIRMFVRHVRTMIKVRALYFLRRMFSLWGFHAYWKILDFFLENARTWKDLENHFGPGKSWKLKLKVLGSHGKISLKITHFFVVSNGNFATLNIVSK